jgi:AcrR family transcriptional regulator
MKTSTTDVSCAERSGGKRLAARRDAFLAAAREVFEEKGYAEATLDDVIARSGGSRQTLYALFGGKQGLFEAIISENCETIFRGLTPEQLASRAPHAACLNLNRLVIAEAPRIPELAERFWKLGPGRSRAFLTEFFDRQIERGVLRMQDSSTAADHFLDMLSGTPRLQCLIGVREPPGPSEIDLMVEAAVTQFLDGCLVK